MRDSAALLKKILGKYRLEVPVPEDIQQYAAAIKRTVLVDVYKSAGSYTVIMGIPLRIYFGVKKIGFSLSFVQSAFVAAFSSLAAVSLLSAVMYYTAVNIHKKVINDKYIGSVSEKKLSIDNSETGQAKIIRKIHSLPGADASIAQEDNKIAGIRKKSLSENIKSDIPALQKIIPINKYVGVTDFTVENLDRKISLSVTKQIRENLAAKYGNEKIIEINTGKMNNIDLMIAGSVGKLGNKIIISVKLVDMQTSRIIFVNDESADSEAELRDKCNIISGKIAKEIIGAQ